MIGQRVGAAVGVNVGVAIGIGSDELGGLSMASVARDATSQKYLPANAAQWTTTLAVAGIASGNPSALHLLQEAAGNPVDSIGSFTLTASGTLAYQQSVSGWTTKGIKTTTGVAGIMQNAAAGLPDISTTSMLALIYVLLPATTSATRSYVTLGPTFGTQTAGNVITSTNKKAQCTAGANTASGADDAASQVRPFLVQINRTGSIEELCTDLDRITPTFTGTPTGKAYILGGDNTQTNFPDTATFIYSAVFFAAAAEMAVANKRSLLSVLGWSPPW